MSDLVPGLYTPWLVHQFNKFNSFLQGVWKIANISQSVNPEDVFCRCNTTQYPFISSFCAPFHIPGSYSVNATQDSPPSSPPYSMELILTLSYSGLLFCECPVFPLSINLNHVWNIKHLPLCLNTVSKKRMAFTILRQNLAKYDIISAIFVSEGTIDC